MLCHKFFMLCQNCCGFALYVCSPPQRRFIPARHCPKSWQVTQIRERCCFVKGERYSRLFLVEARPRIQKQSVEYSENTVSKEILRTGCASPYLPAAPSPKEVGWRLSPLRLEGRKHKVLKWRLENELFPDF